MASTLQNAFKAFDANGDGKLSVAEIAEALAHGDEVRKLYECCKKGSFDVDKVDGDDDLVVQEEEEDGL